MKHTYQVRIHTGDSWGHGCASSVTFQLYGSEINLTSETFVQQELPLVVAKRSQAVLFAASKADSAARKDRKGDVPHSGPPLERRNVCALMSRWLETSGGAAQLKQLVQAADEGKDGLLAMEEVKQLLKQAVPSVSTLETQLFIAMVDVNGDGMLTERELLQSVGDCAGIDAAVASGGSAPGTIAAAGSSGGGVAQGSGASVDGGAAEALAAAVQHLRSSVAAVDTKIREMDPAGGYLTYSQLTELFQAVVPESLGGRATLRALLAHVARTANIAAEDPGVHVLEIKRCFGLQGGRASQSHSGAPAAAAAGWVAGRRRDVFKLLRYHVKHNRGQLDELFPRGTELTVNQVRHLVRQLLETRVGEPPLTGREARHLVAVLDVNANGTLSREEFDGGLRDCRDISAAMSTLQGRDLDPTGLQLDAPLCSPSPSPSPGVGGGGGGGGGDVPMLGTPTWGSFLDALRQLHQLLVVRHEDAESAWKRNDSRRKGRIDACELQKVLFELAPGLMSVPLLRAVLIYVDLWDPSEHALLSRKHLLMALRGDRPPDGLQPPPVAPLADVGEGVTAATLPLQGISQRMTGALYGASVDAGLPGLLPDPAQWQEWHGNVRTPERPSGAVTLGGAWRQLPARAGFWKAQWKCHTAWLAATTAYRLAATGGASSPSEPGTGQQSSAATGSGPASNSAAAAGGAPEPNCLECRLWPPLSVAALPYVSAVYDNELAAWKRRAAEWELQDSVAAKVAHGNSTLGPVAGSRSTQQGAGAGAGGGGAIGLGAQTAVVQRASINPGAVHVPGEQPIAVARPVAEAAEGEGDAAALGATPSAAAARSRVAAAAAAAEDEGDDDDDVAAAQRGSPVIGPPVEAPQPPFTQSGTGGRVIATEAAVAATATATLEEPAPEVKGAPVADGATTGSGEGDALQPQERIGVAVQQVAATAAPAVMQGTELTDEESERTAAEPSSVTPGKAAIATAQSGTQQGPGASGGSAEAPTPPQPVSTDQAAVAPGMATPTLLPGPHQGLSSPALRPSPLFQVPPVLTPARVLSYKVVLAVGAQLGNLESVNVQSITSSSGGAVYLDKVEVLCTTSDPPLMWEVTVRRWMQSGEQLAGLTPDPVTWEEWDMQEGGDDPNGTGQVVYLNRNRGEVVWKAPPRAPLPSLPGAVPNLQLKAVDTQTSSPSGGKLRSGEWLTEIAPLAVPRTTVRFLDSLRGPPAFRPTRVRPSYELGFGGQLGVVPGQEVRVKGQRCSHSIAVMARGGFKAVDPDDPRAARLLPPVGTAAAGAIYSGREGLSAPALVDPLMDGATLPGVRECVVLSYSLDAAAEERGGEKYLWLDGYVALDDSAGSPPAPVRFSVVRDGALVWAKWVRTAGEVYRCCVPVVGCRQLQLVVESDFSGGARAVWMDPYLLCGPIHDKAMTASLEQAAQSVNEIPSSAAAVGGGDVKVSFVTEAGGAIMYMAPARSVPVEVSRSSSVASYRISVFTGALKNGGTRGKVYIRMLGRRGCSGAADSSAVKSNLICLNADGAALKEGDKYSMLEPVTLPWMDEVDTVVLQHVPAPSSLFGGGSAVGGTNDWYIQHVEVSCDETGRTWYFVAGGWFLELARLQQQASNSGAGGAPAAAAAAAKVPPAQLELVLPRATSPNQLKVVFHIISSGKGVGMGIDGDLQMVLVGVDSSGYQYATLSLPGSSVDNSHETRLMESPVALGEIQSVELSCKQQGLLATRLQSIEVVRLADAKHFLFLPPSLDLSEGPVLAATRLVLRAATQPYFRISTFTSAVPEAGTDARIYIDLFGSRGKLMDLYLRDATGDSFSEGCEDVFFFPDPGLGDLGSICISHDDSGESPNWHLDRVEIVHTGTGRTSVFVCKQWIGLGADRKDDNQVEGRFGPDRVLERVLYPTHVLSALKLGRPLLRYHVIFQTADSPRPELWDAAEALQLVGKQADGSIQFSEIFILEGTGRIDMDLELDMQYVRYIQAASRVEAQRGLEDRDSSSPPPASVPAAAVRSMYQVVVKKLAVFESRSNIVVGRLGSRQLSLVIHGSENSCRPIILGADNCTTTGLLPLTSRADDDVFQVNCDIPLGLQLLRADVRLPGNASPSWGILLESVTIRNISPGPSSGEPKEFFAGPRGQWIGVSPDTPEGIAGGTQALHLLPKGCCAGSFVGRALQELLALHVRHDNPKLRPGWHLQHIEVLVSPPAGAPYRGNCDKMPEAGKMGEPTTIRATARQNQEPLLAVSPCLYRFHAAGSPEASNDACWPSSEAPFIRHYLNDKYLSQPFPAQLYFTPPIRTIALAQHFQEAPASSCPGIEENGCAVDLAPSDETAMTALRQHATAALQQLCPERLQALEEEYKAEVEAYMQFESGAGASPAMDIFTLIRARIRAKPELLPNIFSEVDKDKDGKISYQQVHALVPCLLPKEVKCSEQLHMYIRAMLTLGSEEPMTQVQVMSSLKACRSAYKEAASMIHMLQEGSIDWYQVAQEDGLGVEMALCSLAEQLVQPTNSQAAMDAFKKYDTDGSGYLDIGELCKALQSIHDLSMSSREVRLLLAYLFHFGDKDKDLRLSVSELQKSLAPFVPHLAAEEMARAYEYYHLSHNLPGLLRAIIKLKPALIHAACVKAKATSTEAAAGPNKQPRDAATIVDDMGLIPLRLLPSIVAELVPGLDLPAHKMAELQQLLLLDSGLSNSLITVTDLVHNIKLSADAVKLAMSIARLLSSAVEEHEPLTLGQDLQSVEALLHYLARTLFTDEGTKLAEAFNRLDMDGSGYIDGPELCATIRQVRESTSKEELRTLLAYLQRCTERDINGRISIEELQIILKPFRK